MWIIDFEASGLSNKSYPIEVGVTNGSEEYSALIKPMDHWQFWDEKSATVHNIERDYLFEAGLPAADVGSALNDLIGNDTVYCDHPAWDGFWLYVLFRDNALQRRFKLSDIRDLLADQDDVEHYLAARQELEATGTLQRHRALDDAKLIFQSLQQALKA